MSQVIPDPGHVYLGKYLSVVGRVIEFLNRRIANSKDRTELGIPAFVAARELLGYLLGGVAYRGKIPVTPEWAVAALKADDYAHIATLVLDNADTTSAERMIEVLGKHYATLEALSPENPDGFVEHRDLLNLLAFCMGLMNLTRQAYKEESL